MGAAEEMLRISCIIILGPLGDHLLQLRFGFRIELRIPQPIAVGIGVLDLVAGCRNLDLLDQREPAGIALVGRRLFGRLRSEEHTSELQSLMRISYAVFCLKKKNKTQISHT